MGNSCEILLRWVAIRLALARLARPKHEVQPAKWDVSLRNVSLRIWVMCDTGNIVGLLRGNFRIARRIALEGLSEA